MRVALLAAWLAMARLVSAGCLDDCLQRYGGAGDDYTACVADCGVCGNGDLEGDEECDDGNVVSGDCCDATCHLEPEGSPCDDDDDDLCTNGVCDGDGECDSEETPVAGCHEPVRTGRASLVMRDLADDPKDLLDWRWRGGSGTADFGKPIATTTYALCVYDDTGLLASVTLPGGDQCEAHPCWTVKPDGFNFRDRARAPDGAAQVTLRQSRHSGRARIRFKAEGKNLELPDLSALDSPLTVQLRRSDSPVCWSAQYTFASRDPGDTTHFKDRSAPGSQATSTSTSTTTTSSGSGGGPTTTSSALSGATVEVTVLDDTSSPVEDADVTLTYEDQTSVDDLTDAAGVVRFTGQRTGVPVTVSVEDDDGREGETTSPGLQAGTNQITVTVR